MSPRPDPYGRDARRPLHIPLKGWWQVVQRVWTESGRDNLSVIAAGCAFYALFAIFPALSALVAFYGLTSDPAAVEAQFGLLELVLPPDAFKMVVEQTTRIADASGQALGWSFIVSLGLALWSITFLIQAIFSALNVAYEEPERRSFFRFYLSTFLFGLAGIVGGVVTLLAVVYVPIVFAFAGYATDYDHFIVIVRWPVLALMVLFLLACLYRYGPSRRTAKWSWVTAGSLFATVMWLIASAGFSLYVANFANYDKFYGSLGAVIVLMFWLYITFYIVLLGAEINAELELQTAQDTTKGEDKPIGKRGAFVADHVAGGPQGHVRPVSPITANPAAARRGKTARLRSEKDESGAQS